MWHVMYIQTSHVILGKQENIKKTVTQYTKIPICVGTKHGNNSLVVLKTKTSSVKNFISIMNFSTTTPCSTPGQLLVQKHKIHITFAYIQSLPHTPS